LIIILIFDQQYDYFNKSNVQFMSEQSLIERSYAFLINQVIIDWETHSLSSFQSTSSSTLQLFRSISWQVLLFCFMIIWISKHSWFIWFVTIIWFWIEITSLIEFWLAFDLNFKSESDSESDLSSFYWLQFKFVFWQ